jgi:EpsI family protein
LLVLLLVGVGAASWWYQLRPPLRVDPAPLIALPETIGSWQAVDVPLDAAVESILRADFNLQRAYVHPTGAIVFLYVGYYGTDRGGRPEHTPEVCFNSQGWDITARRTLRVEGGGEPLRVSEFVVEKGDIRHLVEFWFRSQRSTGMLSSLEQAFDRLTGRLVDGRADGSLVRISTPLAGRDPVEARSYLMQFAAAVDEQLGLHWPVEIATER